MAAADIADGVTADVATVDELVTDTIESQRDRLLIQLAAQRRAAAALWSWYHGEQAYPVVPSRYRDAYKLLIDMARTPWARLVVDTVGERLHVLGFRAASAELERQAWRTFKASAMNADERLVYTESLITGDGYVSVADGRLAPESAFEVTHEPVPGSRRQVGAALKIYPLEPTWREWACELYRPDVTYRWTARLTEPPENGGFPIDDKDRLDRIQWQEAEPHTTGNPRGVVPMVPFQNRATILGGGVSELKDCIPILQRIDKYTLDALLTSDVAAFRQRWATGLEIPKDPDTGKPVEPFKSAVDRLWVAEGEAGKDVKFGTFEASDLGQYLSMVDSDLAALASISRVPTHYLRQSNLANPPTAESLVAGETGLVAKVRERQARFGEAWERALALALGSGDEPLEVIWDDAEMRNPAQTADAAVKLQAIGWPQEMLWRYTGMTPQQVEEATLEQAAADLTALADGTGTPTA